MDESKQQPNRKIEPEHTSAPIDELRSEFKRLRSDVNLQTIRIQRDLADLDEHRDQTERLRRRVRVMGILAVVFGCALAAGSWWGYQQFRDGEAALAGLPSAEDLVQLIDARVDFVAEMLDDFRADGEIIQGIADQIEDLERFVQQGLAEAQIQTEQVAAQIGDRVQLEVLRRFEEVRPTVMEIAASEEAHRIRITDLEQELVAVRAEMAEELDQIREGHLESDLALTQVERRLAGSERAVEAISHEIGRQRIGFELYEDFRQEIAPGLSMSVSDIDVGYQRVNGWLLLEDEGRVLRIQDHAIQRSLVFYSLNDDRSYEVVFTRVTPDMAFGYVVVPTEAGLDVVQQVQNPDFNEPFVQNP